MAVSFDLCWSLNIGVIVVEKLLPFHELFHVDKLMYNVQVYVNYVSIFQVIGANQQVAIQTVDSHVTSCSGELHSKTAENLLRLFPEDLSDSLYLFEAFEVILEWIGRNRHVPCDLNLQLCIDGIPPHSSFYFNQYGLVKLIPLQKPDFACMFHVKTMSEQDFPFAVQITDQMDWGMVEEDFRFMTELEPEGCFVLSVDQERAGIATTVSFGKKGWFGNLIVKQRYRNKGAGSLLVNHSVEYLKSKGVKTVGLYAYADKVSFYRRLGFEYDSEFIVLRGKGFSSPTSASVLKTGKENMMQIIERDTLCFGASREKILEPIMTNPNNVGYACMNKGRMLGYAIAKVYDSVADLGPLVCPRGRNDLAIGLLEAVLSWLKDAEVSLCLPGKEERLMSMLLKHNFVQRFRVIRMFLNADIVNDCVYVAESLERG